MKLHLPKLLRVALLAVVCAVPTVCAATYPVVGEVDGKTYINVGFGPISNSQDERIVEYTHC